MSDFIRVIILFSLSVMHFLPVSLFTESSIVFERQSIAPVNPVTHRHRVIVRLISFRLFRPEHATALSPGEVLTLNLRGTFRSSDSHTNTNPSMIDDGETMFSTVPLSSSTGDSSPEIIVPSSSPCVDFYYRSGCVIKRKRSKVRRKIYFSNYAI